MSNIQNPIETPLKDGTGSNKLPIKQVAYGILRANGLNVADSEKALNYSKRVGYTIEKKLNQYKLGDSKLISPAFKAIKDTLKMKPILTNEYKVCSGCKGKDENKPGCSICKGAGILRTELYPNHSTRIEAAKMVYDRFDPVVKHVVVNSLKLVGNLKDAMNLDVPLDE